MSPPETQAPEKPPEHRHLTTRDEVRAAVAALFEQAQRQVLIFGPVLERYYFNTARIEELMGKFIARHRTNRIRILTEDTHQVLLDNARFKQLAQRLPDCLSIRQVNEMHRGLKDMFVVADRTGYVHLPDVETFDGLTSIQAPREALQFTRRFESMWEKSEPAPGLHTVGL